LLGPQSDGIWILCATNITAKPGENATLPCRAAESKPVTVLEWSKPDLGENDHVALYRDDRLNYRELNPAYRDRVDLQDREMKNGDVSLVLKNVTFNDTGKYECRVFPRESKHRKRSTLKNEPIICFLLYKKPRCSSQEQNQPPAAEAEPMKVENHQEAE
uniref:Ig-like domain-containing protein n=1 Tax=Poecilia mexicana TaxID=48701 RepID=A0A3B3YGI4_9TELE